MKYYSEITRRSYDTEAECLKAEEEKKQALEEKRIAEAKAKEERELAKKQKDEQREADFKAIEKLKKEKDEAYKIYADCDKTYREALKKFINDYNGFHITYTNVDNLADFKKIFDAWDNAFDSMFRGFF